jgi:hypothetical protein
MRTRNLGVAVAVGITVGWIGACEIEQPPGACKATHSSNYALYDLTEGTGPCAELTGDFIYMSKYNEPGSTENRFSLTPEVVTSTYLQDPRISEFKSLTAFGDYPNNPDESGICEATNLSPINVTVSELAVDGGDPLPAADFSYTFTDVRIASTPQVPGTQWTAKLTYRDGSCTAKYDVTGISPIVTCHTDLDDGGIVAAPEKCETYPDGGPPVSDWTHETSNVDFDLECDSAKVRDCGGGAPCYVCRPVGEIPAVTTD